MGYQLKKDGERQRSTHGVFVMDLIPKKCSVCTLLFSTVPVIVVLSFLFDIQTSPSDILLHASKGLGALQAQVGDSYLFSSFGSPKNPSSITVQEPEHLVVPKLSQKPEPRTDTLGETELKDAPVQSSSEVDNVLKEGPELLSENNITTEPKHANQQEKVDSKHASQEGLVNNDTVTFGEKMPGTKITVVKSGNLEIEPHLAEKVADDSSGKEFREPATQVLQSALNKDYSCDFSVGSWVWDDSYPLYNSSNCPFIDGGFRCSENGRLDKDYMKWRWQPSGCKLPRFDAKVFLDRLRGSRLAFVGDSIGRNNWESMICMLAEVVPNKTRIYEINGEPITKHKGFLSFRFVDYDCTIEYYRSPFLVPQGRSPPGSPSEVKSSLKIDQIDWSAEKWKSAQIIVLNTGHWWTYEKTLRGGNYFQTKKTVHMKMDVGTGFRKAMQTVASWIDKNVDASKTQVFFRSYAPVHFRGGTWKTGGQCHLETKPITDLGENYVQPWSNEMISEVFAARAMRNFNFINISRLSEHRSDGHSSLWYTGTGVPAPKNRQDCSHWCLPGVPDTWNELLYSTLSRNGLGAWSRPIS